MDEKTKYTASVKVMRSHDYCHFEIALGSTEQLDLAGVDAMRKEAARLADKAVEQYKIAKRNAQRRQSEENDREVENFRIKTLLSIPEEQRTPEQKAELKARNDALWEMSHPYDYEDDWQE